MTSRKSPLDILEDQCYWYYNSEEDNLKELDEQLFTEFMISVGWLEEPSWQESLVYCCTEAQNEGRYDFQAWFSCMHQLDCMDYGLPTLEVQIK